MTAKISIFKKSTETKNGQIIPFDVFLENIQNGHWQDFVLPIRAMKDKEQRTTAKKQVPYVTLTGIFKERNNKGLVSPSGFIGIDVDNVDPEEVKTLLSQDKYTYAAFTSISGRGVCVIYKINPDRHADAFIGIQEYLFTNYQLIIDSAARDLSRPRFISYDPHLYINTGAQKFVQYPKKQAVLTKVPEVVYVQNDFDSIIKEISSRRIDITGSYPQWLAIGYGLADKFGEVGRSYFHSISQFSHLYDPKTADRQYDECLKPSASSKTATVATIYFLAKQAGIQIISEQTKLISQTASLAKKGRRTKEDTIKLLQDVEGIKPSASQDIVNQVFDNNILVPTDENMIDQIRTWLKQEYMIERNEVTRKIEVNGKAMDDIVFNDLFCTCKVLFEKSNSEILQRIINSNSTPTYNPFVRFFESNQHRQPKGVIEALFSTLDTDTGISNGEFFPDYKIHFGRKWFVSVISAIHGQHSPLMLVLSGNVQGTGKTEFFRKLLPPELHDPYRDYPDYYTESKLDAGKDDEILMTQKIIIMDDEMGGKNKKEEKRLKELLSKQTFSLREPYGRYNIDLRRLAVLCGTTNDNEILNDPTGNRRIIPINVNSIDHTAYNAIDKTDLIIEAYHLYKSGFNWQLSQDDIKILNDNTGHFEQSSPEMDLLTRSFQRPETEKDPWAEFLTATEIKSQLEMKSGQKLNPTRLGMELKKAGYHRITKKINGYPAKVYHIKKVGSSANG